MVANKSRWVYRCPTCSAQVGINTKEPLKYNPTCSGMVRLNRPHRTRNMTLEVVK